MKNVFKYLLPVIAIFAVSCEDVPESDIIISGDKTVIPEERPDEQQPITENIDYSKRLECPKVKGGDNLIIAKTDKTYGVNYFLEWDCNKRAQRWTAYQMHKGNTVKTVERSGDDAWHEDEEIPDEYRSVPDDYRDSNFDRGHMCPSADRLQNSNMNKQTFCYSNMQPQYNTLNAGPWALMESKVRAWNTDNFRDTLYVVKGGTIDKEAQIFDFKTHGNSGLIIPKYFFMAILCLKNGKYKAIGFWIEHRNYYSDIEKKNIKQYAVSIDQLETFTDIDFFANLPKDVQDEVEKEPSINDWAF